MQKYIILVLFTFLIAGCSQQSDVSDIDLKVEESVGDEISLDIETGSVSGKVLFTGTVPERIKLPYKGNPECVAVAHGEILSETLLVNDGGLQNAFIYIKEGLDEDFEFKAPSTPVDVNNVGCIYVPHVVGAQVNQPIQLTNSDPTFHNIHAFAKEQSGWNLGLPFQGMKQTKKFAKPEVMVKLKCDLHPWMIGYIGIVEHPFFTVSGEDGSFSIPNIPAGDYVFGVWHEKLGEKEIEVSVGANQTAELNVSYSG